MNHGWFSGSPNPMRADYSSGDCPGFEPGSQAPCFFVFKLPFRYNTVQALVKQ